MANITKVIPIPAISCTMWWIKSIDYTYSHQRFSGKNWI